MGKIRVKTFGLEDAEKKQEEDAIKRREAKRAKKADKPEKQEKSAKSEKAQPKVKVPGGKGGERGVQVAPSDDEVEKLHQAEAALEETPKKEEKKKKSAKTDKKKRKTGRRHIMASKNVNANKSYKVAHAIALLRKVKYAKFDEAVEVHIVTEKTGVKGEANLPHGTGKQVRVQVADDATVEKIDKGKIDFDVLIATPSFMPKLVKHAKVLGPKGLMPSPKNGTVTDKPEEAMKKFAGGAIHFKTEPKAPLIHLSIGKMSFTDTQLVENFNALCKAVGKKHILNLHLSSSMGPSVKVTLD